MKTYVIYALMDLTSNQPFYIGMTSNLPAKRLSQHKSESSKIDDVEWDNFDFKTIVYWRCNCRKCKWIRQIGDSNIAIQTLEEHTGERVAEVSEQLLIRRHLARGIELTNSEVWT